MRSETSEYESPVIMERVEREVTGQEGMFQMVEVRHAKTGEMLATCMMSDDLGLEKIADLLSIKRLWREANRFRQMVYESRRPGCVR